MTLRQLLGDCRETLRTLEPGSVQACITSPPYYSLRDYGTPPLVWGGEADCRHIFGLTIPGDNRGGSGTPTDKNNRGEGYGRSIARGSFCPCGAWLGSLGLEPTPELFIEHLVECFREVRRVLADDGCIWVNMGDSYAGSGNGSNDYRENGASLSKDDRKYIGQRPRSERARGGLQGGTQTVDVSLGGRSVRGLKAKDLMMMPARVAMALQADGWYLRSQIPWLKRNSMPESVTDRPVSAVEYVFLLSKSARYFWDADAVRQSSTNPDVGAAFYARRGLVYKRPKRSNDSRNADSGTTIDNTLTNGRNCRNTDWFFESWQGLMIDEADAPLALVVNPMPFKGSHFATFPPKLVEPMVKASTRPGDTVLDPFSGAGTTLMVADRLGRNAIGCELSEAYSDLGAARLVGDAPMFVDLESA